MVAAVGGRLVLLSRRPRVLVVEERLVERLVASAPAADPEALFARARNRWSAAEIPATWSAVAGEPTLRSPELDVASLDDVAALVVDLAPSPRRRASS